MSIQSSTEAAKIFKAIDPRMVLEALAGTSVRVRCHTVDGAMMQGLILNLSQRTPTPTMLMQLTTPQEGLAYIPISMVASVVVLDVSPAALFLGEGDYLIPPTEADMPSLEWKRQAQGMETMLNERTGHAVTWTVSIEKVSEVKGVHKASLGLMHAIVDVWVRLSSDPMAKPLLAKIKKLNLEFLPGSESQWSLSGADLTISLGVRKFVAKNLADDIQAGLEKVL